MQASVLISLFLLHWSFGHARPWEIQPQSGAGPYAGAAVPGLVAELDNWGAALLSSPSTPVVGAGAALAYLAYAGAMVVTGNDKRMASHGAVQGRSSGSGGSDFLTRMASSFFNQGGPSNSTGAGSSSGEDLLARMASSLVQDTLSRSKTAEAFRRVGGRALHTGARMLRLAVNYFSRTVGGLFSALTSGRQALQPDCLAKHMCRIGQMTGSRWPLLGAMLRSFDSSTLDHHAQALIDGTTNGDCSSVSQKCPD